MEVRLSFLSYVDMARLSMPSSTFETEFSIGSLGSLNMVLARSSRPSRVNRLLFTGFSRRSPSISCNELFGFLYLKQRQYAPTAKTTTPNATASAITAIFRLSLSVFRPSLSFLSFSNSLASAERVVDTVAVALELDESSDGSVNVAGFDDDSERLAVAVCTVEFAGALDVLSAVDDELVTGTEDCSADTEVLGVVVMLGNSVVAFDIGVVCMDEKGNDAFVYDDFVAFTDVESVAFTDVNSVVFVDVDSVTFVNVDSVTFAYSAVVPDMFAVSVDVSGNKVAFCEPVATTVDVVRDEFSVGPVYD